MFLWELNEAAKAVKTVTQKGLGLSLTKIKTFDMCEYKYFLQYILPKSKNPENAEIQAKIKADKADFNPDYFKKGQLAHKHIESALKGTVCDFKSTSLSDEDTKNTIDSCQSVYDNEYINSIKHASKIEEPYALYITSEEEDGLTASSVYDKKADFSGYIDFYAKIDDTIHVVDWKTGAAKTKKDDDTFMQLFIYAKACQKLFGGSKFVLSYFYVNHGKIVTRELTVPELNGKLSAIVNKGISIPSTDDPNDYKAKPDGCGYCPFSKVKNGAATCKFAVVK